MIAAILKETTLGENRVAATPKTVKELIKSGLTVRIQSEAGKASFYSDQDYIDAGAEVISDISSLYNNVNIILKVAPATIAEIESFPNGTAYVSLMQTTRQSQQVQKLKIGRASCRERV